MELSHLKYFYDVAKAGSFTSAARHLRISQPSLSKAVALLEARESVKLLKRSKSGVVLTEVGAEVFAQCEKIFESLEDVKNLCAGKKELCEGPLHLGASDHLSNYFLVDKIVEAKKIHPKLKPSIFVGAPQEIASKLISKEIEFGLFFTKIKDASLVYEELLSFPLVAVMHPSLMSLLKNKKLKSQQNMTVNYISSIRKDYIKNPAQDVLDTLGIDPDIQIEANSQELQKRLCMGAQGLAILLKFMVEDEIRKGKLIEVPMSKTHSATLYLAKRKGNSISLNASSFLKILK
jgi:DNA-binding transcriptional LysR family regulator